MGKNLNNAQQKNAQDTFNEIYRTSHWGQGSGSGSLPENAQEWIHTVNQLIRERKITSIIDVGCGDFQLGQHYNLAGINYLGVDVSDQIISKNSVYENSLIKFRSINAELFEFPKTDLILIKDVFQHLPNASIVRIFKKIVESAPYILICNDFINLDGPNNDIEVGGWRGLDLLKDPFNFDLQSVCQYESGLEIKQIYLFSRTKI